MSKTDPDFIQVFREAEQGSCFRLMEGEVPGPEDTVTAYVSSYDYAKLTDFLPVFGEDFMIHTGYSIGMPEYQVALRGIPNRRYAFDADLPDFRLRKIKLMGTTQSAGLLALGGLDASDFWLIKE